MTLVGVVFLVVGALMTGMSLAGIMPDALAAIPAPGWAWVALAAAGALLIYFNRRPGN